MKTLLAAAALASGALLFGGSAVASADTTVTVTPASFASGGHWFTADTRSPGTGIFETGPAIAPIGTGSFELDTPDVPAKVQLFTDLYNGTLLSTIDGIGYSTYQEGLGPAVPAMVGLNLRVDLNNDSTPDAYLVYEPYQDLGNGALQRNVWQSWDAYRGGAAKWWINTGAGGCGQNTPCTWSHIVTAYPAATVRDGVACGSGNSKTPCPGSLGLNQGSSNAGAHSNADALYVSVAGTRKIFNFEPSDTTKPTCGSLVVRPGTGPNGEAQADVTISDTGSGIASITNFTVSNGTFNIPGFTAGDSSVTVTATKTDQGQLTHFAFDVTDQAGNTTHCV